MQTPLLGPAFPPVRAMGLIERRNLGISLESGSPPRPPSYYYHGKRRAMCVADATDAFTYHYAAPLHTRRTPPATNRPPGRIPNGVLAYAHIPQVGGRRNRGPALSYWSTSDPFWISRSSLGVACATLRTARPCTGPLGRCGPDGFPGAPSWGCDGHAAVSNARIR